MVEADSFPWDRQSSLTCALCLLGKRQAQLGNRPKGQAVMLQGEDRHRLSPKDSEAAVRLQMTVEPGTGWSAAGRRGFWEG